MVALLLWALLPALVLGAHAQPAQTPAGTKADAGTEAACSRSRSRQPCGYYGTSAAACEALGCCWVPSGRDPWCFAPDAGDEATYLTAQRTPCLCPAVAAPTCSAGCAGRGTSGNASQLLLLQLAQSVLPHFGADIERLAVVVELQTPQRLHVKISPAAPAPPRWEVPAWLMPRCVARVRVWRRCPGCRTARMATPAATCALAALCTAGRTAKSLTLLTHCTMLSCLTPDSPSG
jgi:hypothetical protein